MTRSRKTTTLLNRNRALLILILLALIVGAAWHFHSHTSNSSDKIVTAGTVVQPRNSVADSNTPVNKSPAQSAGSRNIGTATDTNGQASPAIDSSQWVVSSSGNITVKQPSANAKLKDGDVLSGSAKVDKVHYRLNDNQVGVISQGDLNVVNGNFSGTLHFSPEGTGGRLSVFTADSMGVEHDEVQINLSF